MSLRKRLIQKGVSNSQIAFAAQGFVDLLADQLTLSAEMARQAKMDQRRGRTKAANEKIIQIGKTMKHAAMSREMATLLLSQDGQG